MGNDPLPSEDRENSSILNFHEISKGDLYAFQDNVDFQDLTAQESLACHSLVFHKINTLRTIQNILHRNRKMFQGNLNPQKR